MGTGKGVVRDGMKYCSQSISVTNLGELVSSYSARNGYKCSSKCIIHVYALSELFLFLIKGSMIVGSLFSIKQ